MEYTKEQLEEMLNSKDRLERIKAANQGYGLDVLVKDSDWMVREAVANQGFGLEQLVNDDVEFVRAAVARQGVGLNILVDDPHWIVRKEVALKGVGLDKLIYDTSETVRQIALEKQKLVQSFEMKQGAVFESSLSKKTTVLEILKEGKDAILFTGNEFVYASGIEKQGNNLSWERGKYSFDIQGIADIKNKKLKSLGHE